MRSLFRKDSQKKQLVINDDSDEGSDKRGHICSHCQVSALPKRYQMSVMIGMGFLISFGIRCNMGVAVIAMTRNDTIYTSQSTINSGNGSYTVQMPAFDWSPNIVGTIESSYFWGYLITQVPGGYVAARYPANRVFGISLVISSVLNLLIPGAATLHYGMVMVVRFLQGLSEGTTYPACHGIWRFWAPPVERSRLVTIAFTGSYAGAIVGLPLSGILTDQVHWGASFYFYGAVGILWFITWWFLSSERPAVCFSITEEERIYIEESIGETSSFDSKMWIKPPWAAFFRSLPVWAIIVANFCRSWTFYLMIIDEAAYFKDVHGYTVGQQGLLAALPHIAMTLVVPIAGVLADFLRKQYFSTTIVRKLFNCGGFGLEAIFLLILAFITDNSGALAVLTIAVGFSGFAISGFNVNHLDIAPRYASILMGISNCAGTIAALFVPIVVAKLTTNGTRQEWGIVFLISSLLHVLGVIFYAVFASGEKQPWAEPCDDHAETIISLTEQLKQVDELTGAYGSITPTEKEAIPSTSSRGFQLQRNNGQDFN